MVGVNGYRVLQACVITFKGALLFSQYGMHGSTHYFAFLMGVHMYLDSRLGVPVNGPNIILYYTTKCREWGLQPPSPPF